MSVRLRERAFGLGVALIVVGVILALVVFVEGYRAYKSYEIQVNTTTNNTAAILNLSAQALINMLVKISFLGISLAAATVLLSKGVDLAKGCPEED